MARMNALPKEQATARDIPSVAWAYVRLIAGTSQNGEWCLSSETGSARIRLGTATECDWRIGGPAVQPVHVELVWDGAVLWAIDLAQRGDVAAAGELVVGPTPLRGLVCLAFGGAALLVETSQLDLVAGPLPSRTVRRQPPEESAGARPTAPAKPAAGEGAEAARQLGRTVPARPVAIGSTGPARSFDRTVRAKPGARSEAGAVRDGTPADPQVTAAFAALTSMDPQVTVSPAGPQPTPVTLPPRAEAAAEVGAPRPRLGLAARPADPAPARRDERAAAAGGSVAEPTLPRAPKKEPNWKKRAQLLHLPSPPATLPDPEGGAEQALAEPATSSDIEAGAAQAAATPAASPWRSEPPAIASKKPAGRRRALLLASLVPATVWLALSSGGPTEAAAPRDPATVAPVAASVDGEEEGAPAPEPTSGLASSPEALDPEELANEELAPGVAAAAEVADAPAERRGRAAGDQPTDERVAIDLVVAGRYAEAAARYEVLAQESPERPELAVVARILRRKITESCKGGTPCTP